MSEAFEKRLDSLREEARQKGYVGGLGVKPVGGPIPAQTPTPEGMKGTGYYGLPIIKPPVGKWMIPAYFFVGGLAGMSGLLAASGGRSGWRG